MTTRTHHARAARPAARPQPGEDLGCFPAEYFVAARPDGNVLVVQGAGPRRALRRGLSTGAVVWNGALAMLLAGAFGSLGGPDPVIPALLIAAMTLGGFLAHGTLWRVHGREEWHAGPGYLERRWGWSFSQSLCRRRYTAGEFEIWRNPKDPCETWDLYFKPRGNWLGAQLICRVEARDSAVGRLRNLAAVLSRCTGWQVVERAGAVPAVTSSQSGTAARSRD